MKINKKIYSSDFELMGTVIKPVNRVFNGQKLITNSGKKLTVTSSNAFWIHAKLGKNHLSWENDGKFFCMVDGIHDHLNIDWNKSKAMLVNN